MNAANPDTALVVRTPAHPAQLFLLFHGYGANAHALLPVAERLAVSFPQAMIVSVNAPDPTPNVAGGFQWFSAVEITEENRVQRVAQTMPRFIACIQYWQTQSGVAPEATALFGFSQGAIMALEATQHAPLIAARIVSAGGRFAALPQRVPVDCVLHFIHGKNDEVIHYGFTVEGAETLIARGADVTADVIPHLAHGIDESAMQAMIDRLQTYVPRRMWEEALRGEGAAASNG
jgi:phospholipase/carboxylesterase